MFRILPSVIKKYPLITTSTENILAPTIRNFGTKKKRKGLSKHQQAVLVLRKRYRENKKTETFLPVINAPDREAIRLENEKADQEAADEMKRRIASQQVHEPLRFEMTGLEMSDRVRKMFDLSLGNQREIVKVQKARGMELFQRREGDTGSSEVQVIALTADIQKMQTHLQKHRKDHNGKRSLDRLYVRRRKCLDYMERTDFSTYRRVVKTLGLVR